MFYQIFIENERLVDYSAHHSDNGQSITNMELLVPQGAYALGPTHCTENLKLHYENCIVCKSFLNRDENVYILSR